jgi:hypothetical protein
MGLAAECFNKLLLNAVSPLVKLIYFIGALALNKYTFNIAEHFA